MAGLNSLLNLGLSLLGEQEPVLGLRAMPGWPIVPRGFFEAISHADLHRIIVYSLQSQMPTMPLVLTLQWPHTHKQNDKPFTCPLLPPVLICLCGCLLPVEETKWTSIQQAWNCLIAKNVFLVLLESHTHKHTHALPPVSVGCESEV